jgi:hypothetical protein
MSFEKELQFLNEEMKNELELRKYIVNKMKNELELRKYIVNEIPMVTKHIFIKYNNDGSVYSRTTFIKYNNNNKYYKKVEYE